MWLLCCFPFAVFMKDFFILLLISAFCNIFPIREQDGQASGGNDFGSDDWIFTIREKDPKKLQNGEGQSTDEVRVFLLQAPFLTLT